MKNYHLDPDAPHELTPAGLEALDAAPIDYSDIPPLEGDSGDYTIDRDKWQKNLTLDDIMESIQRRQSAAQPVHQRRTEPRR